MIIQLKALEQTILEVRKQYQATAEELKVLQNKPHEDSLIIAQLEKVAQQLNYEKDVLKNQLLELDKRYQNLAEAHQQIGESQDKLQQKINDLHNQNEELRKQNHLLTEKNRIAAEHTRIVLERLTQIDQEDY